MLGVGAVSEASEASTHDVGGGAGEIGAATMDGAATADEAADEAAGETKEVADLRINSKSPTLNEGWGIIQCFSENNTYMLYSIRPVIDYNS